MIGPSTADFRVIIPVRNGGTRWIEAATALADAIDDRQQVIVVDSESSDGSDEIARNMGFVLRRIPVRTFNHGRTRHEAMEEFAAQCQSVVFLTQDAVIENRDSISSLLSALSEPDVAAAFGRQVPHLDAKIFEAHAAHFNYGLTSSKRTILDRQRLGIKTAYFSNSFAAYKVAALRTQGGFPSHLILGEDTFVAAKLLLAGYAIRYCAEARVRHSHDYSVLEEARRYFDFGVMHAQIPELLREFGSPEGEGMAFVRSELRYVSSRNLARLPECVARNIAKYLAYRLGRLYRYLPRSLNERLSMTKVFWRAGSDSLLNR